ncbi:DEAD/DEAH box helicase family protein [Fulvimarina sp. 2208YS6-2-32]|uniref:DEAD/DEAH box helicase family protein n=1 Tax=Fulvimarina uroteuthidis TaxID=3098149 RepID=A0ABU5I1B0_9HYPH|nr:DEAD/DEAH box helicase family protein [Fulvimarina sp. 2208YS6-2-32]MDY8109132.1 DEAD/DEAH box helicase family protein [Fulvimarina sp. 2208YS6-2-32]
MGKTLDAQQLVQLQMLFHKDIEFFAQEMFGVQLRPKQIEFARAFQDNSFITFKGGVGFGKTYIMAVLTWWALITHNEVQVTVFGPNETQIRQGLWKEIGRFHGLMKLKWFKDQYDYTATRAFRKKDQPNCFAEIQLADKDNTTKARGIHSRNNFIFVDEATGVADEVIEVLINISTDANPKLCLISNPTTADCFFGRTWLDPEISPDWAKVHGQMKDNPDLKGDAFEKLVRAYGGAGSRLYRINILGEFPLDSEESMISAELVTEATLNTTSRTTPQQPIIWGLDPAGGGKDRSVLIERQGGVVGEPWSWQGITTDQLQTEVADLYHKTPASQRPDQICVDAIGVGDGVYNYLRMAGLPVRAIKVSNRPTRKPELFSRLRDQLWWSLKDWLEEGDRKLPAHDDLSKQICLPTYEYRDGRIKVEAKDQMRKRGRGSPDFADALCLTFGSTVRIRGADKYLNKAIAVRRSYLA